ncbi:MAG TPA: aminotransferase, partial [Cytophagales bacterium]|nr:aminotransferase [Cytophagales bacterium]
MSFIPFLSFDYQHRQIERELKQVFNAVVKKGKFILGEEVSLFEREFASYQKTKYCIGVGNGHDALLISLKSLGVGQGDEVIVPSHT